MGLGRVGNARGISLAGSVNVWFQQWVITTGQSERGRGGRLTRLINTGEEKKNKGTKVDVCSEGGKRIFKKSRGPSRLVCPRGDSAGKKLKYDRWGRVKMQGKLNIWDGKSLLPPPGT